MPRQPRLAAVDLLSAGVVATSLKPDERRLAIHPAHVERIEPALRRRLFLERGYGERFGFSDDQLEPLVGGLRSRERAARGVRRGMLPKPLPTTSRRCARARWCGAGRTACRTREMTQLAIERGLTLIAFEAMNHWTEEGNFSVHVFHKNNELAGYCSVLHALAAARLDRRLRPPPERGGDQLRRDRARGGARAVGARVSDVTVLTQRSVRRRLAVRVGADAPLRRDATDPRRSPSDDAGGRWPECSPSTTSSSTASSRTPTTR